MIRRARLSFKPNVRPGGRSVGSAARDGGPASQAEECVQPGDCTVTAGPREKSIADEEKPLCVDGGEGQGAAAIPKEAIAASGEHEASKPATAPIQRRKRISTLPNLAKPRVSSSAPFTVSQGPPQVDASSPLPVSSVPSKDEVSSTDKAKIPSSLKSQGDKGQHVTLPEKRTPVPHVPQYSPQKKVSLKQLEVSPIKSVDLTHREELSPLKERPSQKSSINEYNKCVPKKLVASGNLEKERIRRAQKLRELLRDEMRKERTEWKMKHPILINKGELERSKMVMRDFIYFIPTNNPMTSTFAETKSGEKAPTDSQLTGTPVKSISNEEDNDLDEEEDEDKLLAPRVKVAEDGSIILDEESLTVEVSRMKAPIVEGNDPIFERGSTTTYSSFRKSNYSKPWSSEETDMFYLAINMVGTDFSMISQLFPHRERIEIKNKFKREEKTNSWRIDKAFKERRTFDMMFFGKRLEKALEAAKKKRMTPRVRAPREKKATKQRKKEKDKAEPEEVLGDGELALLSGEGTHASTEEKENEGSVSAKECFMQSENVPGKKRRSRKKKNENKETEEEESLLENTTTLPKKPRKSRAADQVTDSDTVANGNLEDVQVPPDTVQEKKKKTRRKKSTDKEIETENIGDVDVVVSSPQRNQGDKKSTSSASADDTESLICRESGEPSFTQSEVLTCEEDSSLVLFTEESACFSESEDLSSLQESLSVLPGSLTLADQTGTLSDVPVETSQDDSVFEASHHLTSTSPECICLEDDMAVDGHTQTKVEGASESQKNSPIRPAALTKSRFQTPKPNVPVRKLAKQENVFVPNNDDVAENLSPKQDISVDENLDGEELAISATGSPKKHDIPSSVQENSSFESSQLQPGESVPTECAAVKEDISKEKPLSVRGRLVRPKPNLKNAPVKDKPPAPRPRSPESNSQVPFSVVPTPVCTSVSEKESHHKETADSSTGSQDKCRKSTNTVGTSNKEIYEDTEDCNKCSEVSSEDATGDVSSSLPTDCIKEGSTSDDISVHQESHIPLAEMHHILPRDPKPAAGVNLSEEAQKPAVPTRGQLQRQEPNLGRALPRREVLSSSDDSRNVCEVEAIKKPHESRQVVISLSPVEVDIAPVLAKGAADERPFTEETSQPYMQSMEQTIGFPSVKQTESRESVDGSALVSVCEEEKSAAPTKAALTRSGFQRPKATLGSSVINGTQSVPQTCDQHERGESKEDRTDSSSMQNNDAGERPVLTNTDPKDVASPGEITQSYVLPLETIVLPGVDQMESKESSSVSITTSSPVKIKKDLSTPKDERLVKPLPALPRSRLQRPKPNLGRSVSRPAVSAPQKCDDHEEKKATKDRADTLSMEESGNSWDKQNVEQSPKSSPAAGRNIEPGIEEEILESCGGGCAQPEESSCTEEQGEGSSVKPLRNRLQKPKPNLGQAAVRKDSGAFASEQKEKNSDSSSKSPEYLQSKDPDSALTKDAAGGNRAESAHTDIKPAQLRRGRLTRPVPNLGKAPMKRKSAVQSKMVDNTEASTAKEEQAVSTSEWMPDQSPKGSGLTCTSPSSSESAMGLSISTLHESSHSNQVPEDIKQQHSRFGRQLKRPASTMLPELTKPSETVSERPKKEKITRSVKSVKSKAAKPTSRKGKGKTTLVKIRAMKQEEDDDDDDAAELEFEDEDYDVAPDMLNQAPVFVPFSLRSPKPVPAEIEVTLEEVPVFLEDPDNIGHCDGSTEAAMALISMGNSVFQSDLGETLDSDRCTENLLPNNTDCKAETSTLSVQMVCEADENTTLQSRPVNITQDTIGLQEGNEALCFCTEEQIIDLSISNPSTSKQPSQLLNNNMSFPSTHEDAQQQNCSVSDGALETGRSGEEATFILTLVEIPISGGYPYSFEGESVEVLPAPVLIPSNTSQVLTQDQSCGNATVSKPPSSESCLSAQGEAKLSSSSRKRSASVSSKDDEPQPCKKALLCASAEQGEENRARAAESEKNSSLPDKITKGMEESHQSSVDKTTISKGEEKLAECTDDGTRLGPANPESTSYDPPRILSPSLSSRTPQRSATKPLGFLSLVCKEKQSKKTKVTSKKNVSKPKCKKARVQEPEDQSTHRINEVPSQSSSSVEPSTPTNTCQVSENLEAISQESPKSQDLATEEEASTVSEYFFSDIFMEVDE